MVFCHNDLRVLVLFLSPFQRHNYKSPNSCSFGRYLCNTFNGISKVIFTSITCFPIPFQNKGVKGITTKDKKVLFFNYLFKEAKTDY